MVNYELSQVNRLGYADGRGYAIQIENRDNGKSTKHLLANGYQVAIIGDVLAEGDESPETPARDVHLRYAETFANLLRAMNAHEDNASTARQYYAWQRSKDGHPASAYAHVLAAMECAVAEIVPNHADEVMDTWAGCQESVRYCVEHVEKQHVHRLSVADAERQRGCWLEGSRGWRAQGELVNIAASKGMPLDEDGRAKVDHYLAAENSDLTLSTGEVASAVNVPEVVTELADDAEIWLNEQVAPEGWSFRWHDGEFFLYPDSDWDSITIY